MRRTLSLVAAAAVVVSAAARADGPPRPPEGHPIAALASRTTWTAPEGGGICMDMPAALYQVDRLRYYEARIAAAEAYAEKAPWKALLIGVSAGLAVSATVALVRR